MTARTSYADLGWLPDCENEPDNDNDDDLGDYDDYDDYGPCDGWCHGEDTPGTCEDCESGIVELVCPRCRENLIDDWPDDEEDAVPVRIDDDHPDLNDLPDPWAHSPGWDDNSKGS